MIVAYVLLDELTSPGSGIYKFDDNLSMTLVEGGNIIPMITIKNLNIPGYEEVIFCQDDEAGLKAIIAIHDTTLGPAVGGTRMLPYGTEDEALADVLRLSRAMTYKAAAAGLDFGGGKAVIIGDARRDKSEKLLRAFGRFVESFDGRFLTAEDVGTSPEDMRVIGQETEYATCPPDIPEANWQTSFITAFGIFRGIQASVMEMYGSDSLSGIRIAIQGIGKVGDKLARILHAEGAKLTIADLDRSRLLAISKELGAAVVEPHEIYQVDTDILAPCALGGVLNDDIIPLLGCNIVAGAANNQLADERHAEELSKKGILYAPDYIINAGGLISTLYDIGECDRQTVIHRTAEIYDRLRVIFDIARLEKISTQVAADRMVEERIRQAKRDMAK
ncbi:glutamate dehydrogenase/leucine dehydrogenase [Candidatus Methanoperedens nitroreducens]|uniref:Glutamate dehydrogenase/leucine dehydrogenase n=2 Tax=Candidatus Methanoperedens nitratireducens TaxID=1392998 RepID=A0A062V3T0_9EURY|nr:glutamate dehydrogenase/leucine dehydrogenase [Candidatus Methanoperedens nitroreducens]MDJ1420882.1 Glu/Leu/Phe/Val dehydrogenase dimerization domain-containing protein [Candidatus Methanoperedens sp.]